MPTKKYRTIEEQIFYGMEMLLTIGAFLAFGYLLFKVVFWLAYTNTNPFTN